MSAALQAGFLNVDLDVVSRSDLTVLIAAMAKGALEISRRRSRGSHAVSFELLGERRSADATIRGLLDLVEKLPADARRIWDGAQRRSFDIGLEAGRDSRVVTDISPEVLRRVAAVRGRIAVTVYPR